MIARACRLLIGVALVWSVALTAAAPEVPRACAAAALAILACSLWRPGIGLVLIAALTPAGLLLAPAPTRAAELVAWAFLAGWLLGVWRPLTRTGWPRALAVPALVYAACAVASWLGLTIGGAAGIGPAALPLFVFHAIPPDHLLFSSPEPETWTLLQTLAGTSLFLAALGLSRDEPGVARGVAWALAVSMAALGVATLVAVVRQWSTHEYATWFLRQYISSERFTLHLGDLNAAGSQYVLAGLTALGMAAFDRSRRWIWVALLVVMTPAAWLTGSRSAGVVAAAIGVLTMVAATPGRRWSPTRLQVAALATTAILVLVASGLVLARDANVKGSAGRSMRLRTQFSQTSARMFASAPVFGVGIGRYHGRSGEFMPDELRALYGFENAHNYFAQEFAELGVVGGAIFIWLIVAAVQAGWRCLRGRDTVESVATALFAGSVAYLLTCVTGHPLLVSEAAFPFWLAIGAMAGISLHGSDGLQSSISHREHRGHRGNTQTDVDADLQIRQGRLEERHLPRSTGETEESLDRDKTQDNSVSSVNSVARVSAARRRGTWVVVALIALALAANIGRGALAYMRATAAPPAQGFHPLEVAADGKPFQWTTRHAVTYVDKGLGFLTLTMRAPDVPAHRPVIVETQIEGRTVDRRELPPGQWVTAQFPVRRQTTAPFRRVDLRVNQTWTRQQQEGERTTDDLLGVMVRDIRWTPAGPR